MTYALFIDDDGRKWRIARTVTEAKELVATHGWPAHISFDHDLGEAEEAIAFAHWMVEQDLGGAPTFHPGLTWTIHSQNPVGGGNIAGLLQSYERHKARP
jgi:hypothetical protein